MTDILNTSAEVSEKATLITEYVSKNFKGDDPLMWAAALKSAASTIEYTAVALSAGASICNLLNPQDPR